MVVELALFHRIVRQVQHRGLRQSKPVQVSRKKMPLSGQAAMPYGAPAWHAQGRQREFPHDFEEGKLVCICNDASHEEAERRRGQHVGQKLRHFQGGLAASAFACCRVTAMSSRRRSSRYDRARLCRDRAEHRAQPARTA